MLIPFKMEYSCCVSLWGNLDFLDFLQKKFYNIDYRTHSPLSLKLRTKPSIKKFNKLDWKILNSSPHKRTTELTANLEQQKMQQKCDLLVKIFTTNLPTYLPS